MDYKKIYINIINKAKNRELNDYVEKHHIIPKCVGGPDNEENIVKLTAKEHYLVHKLLVKIYPYEDCLKYAFWMMSHRVSGVFTSSKIYSETKEFLSKNMRKNVGTPEAIKKMSESRKGQQLWKGKSHTKESKEKMSISAKNRSTVNEDKRRKRISDSNKGKKKSDEHIENIRKAKLGDKNPMFGKTGINHPNSKKVFQYDLDNNFIKEWDNAKQASTELIINYASINNCCRGKQSTAGKFIWKYGKNCNIK